MKILVGGIYHESHSFSSEPTDIEVFRKSLLFEGPDVIEKMRGTTSEMAGFLRAADHFNFEVAPTIWAWGLATGPVQAGTVDYFLDVVRRHYEQERDIDGFLFALHGALVAEQALDGDGYILSRLRSLGQHLPIAVTVDFHANISQQMVQNADVIVGYDSYPHIDQVERGFEAAQLLVRTIRGEIKPTMVLEKIPMVIVPHVQFTESNPMKDLIAMAHEAEREALSVTVSGGFAYSDVFEIGPSVLVITDNQPELARRHAAKIAARMWDLREEFAPELPTVAEAVAMALSRTRGPVILADVGDNIGAGTPGDGTFILSELFAQEADGAVVTIADPEAVGQAIATGVGEEIRVDVGGKCDSYHGKPVLVEGRVKLISDGVFRNRGHMRDGVIEKMGRTAVIASRGITLILTENKMPPWNLEQLRSVGVTPEACKLIVVKSAIAFRAAYEPIAAEIIEVNSPGLSSVDLSQFKYKQIRRPLYPLDPILKADSGNYKEATVT